MNALAFANRLAACTIGMLLFGGAFLLVVFFTGLPAHYLLEAVREENDLLWQRER
jgi:hypothetical protein